MENLTQHKPLDRTETPDLICEEAIMHDKQRFGRVRTSLMRHLREQYGYDVANRALSRINKRVSEGSLNIKKQISSFEDDF